MSSSLKVDDYLSFKKYFMANLRKISAKTMLKTIGEIDEDLLDANICWLMTDNILEVLKASSTIDNFNGNVDQTDCGKKLRNPKKFTTFLENHFKQDCLLQIYTSSCTADEKSRGDDHWYSVIISGEDAILVEWSEKDCHLWEKQNKNDFMKWMVNMMIGNAVPRFGGKTSNHTVKVWVFRRKAMSKDSVDQFLTE
jgi:hypothetical protein